MHRNPGVDFGQCIIEQGSALILEFDWAVVLPREANHVRIKPNPYVMPLARQLHEILEDWLVQRILTGARPPKILVREDEEFVGAENSWRDRIEHGERH
jgi:hypothetical protein